MSFIPTKKALERVQERLEGIADTIASLERKHRNLELEYIDLYDKVKRQMSRMAKRYAVDTQELNEEPVVEEADDGLDPISRNILALRQGPRTDL